MGSINNNLSSEKMAVAFILRSEFDCNICNKKFQSEKGLKAHNLNDHGFSKQCKLCLRLLRSGFRRDSRIRHLLTGCEPFQKVFEIDMQFASTFELRKEIAKEYADAYFYGI
eukprot:NODE_787_length_3895_cov_0.922813.p4 type:complete len:112 gc:universal NODE_787_length_3895_cov_0.922813:2752-2417(-)